MKLAWRLNRGQGLKFHRGHSGEWLEIRHGRVWLTRREDGADHVLEAGDRFDLRDSRDVVVEALGDTELVWISPSGGGTGLPALVEGAVRRFGQRASLP